MTEKRNILIVGITGSGKSALSNVLVNEVDENGKFKEFKEVFKESAGGTSETKTFQKGNFEWKGTNYYVIDNIGFGDNRNELVEEAILYEIGKGIYLTKEGIDQVFFVFKDRFSPEQINNFKLFEKLIFESGITKFTTLVRTNFSNFRNSQECEEDRQKLINESDIIREIVNSCNGIVHVENPPLPIIKESDSEKQKVKKEEKRSRNKEKRDDSREKVLKHLVENCHGTYKLKEWDNIYSIVANYIEKEKELEQGNVLDKEKETKRIKNEAVAKIKEKLEKELSAIRAFTATIEQNTQK